MFENPGFQNPGFQNPGFQNETYEYSSLFNPGFQNPGFQNTAIGDVEGFTDITWEIKNDGNAAGSVALNPFLDGATEDTVSQLLVTKPYVVPTIQSCEPGKLAVNQVLMNVANPELTGAATAEAGSVFLEPGETIFVTLRVFAIAAPPPAEEPEPPLPGEPPPPPVEPPPPPPPVDPPSDAGIAVVPDTCPPDAGCTEENPEPPPIIDGDVPDPSWQPVDPAEFVLVKEVVKEKMRRNKFRYRVRLKWRNLSGADAIGAFRAVLLSHHPELKAGEADGLTDEGLPYFEILPELDAVWKHRKREKVKFKLIGQPPLEYEVRLERMVETISE